MPLADDGRLIAGRLEQLRKGLLRAVEDAGRVVEETVGARVFAREHAGAARAAQRVGHEAVREAHAVAGDAVQIRGLHVAGVVAAHHLGRVVVRHDVDDIGAVGTFRLLVAGRGSGQDARQQKSRLGIVPVSHVLSFGLSETASGPGFGRRALFPGKSSYKFGIAQVWCGNRPAAGVLRKVRAETNPALRPDFRSSVQCVWHQKNLPAVFTLPAPAVV